MITEDEARQKWCPLARVWAAGEMHPNGANRFVSDSDHTPEKHTEAFVKGTTCMASACMAWRWDWENARTREISRKGEGMEVVTQPTHGYCGAFGHPEPAFIIKQ